MTYANFDIEIARFGETLRVRVLDSPAGSATADLQWPFERLEYENMVLRIRTQRIGLRRLGSPQLEAAKQLGTRLFDAIFPGDMFAALRTSQTEAKRLGQRLRIRLRLTDAPELSAVPWEYLYDKKRNSFLSLSVETPIVRYLDLAEPIEALRVAPPLRILVMISSPKNHPALDGDAEWTNLNVALRKSITSGLVELERLEQATLGALQHRLRQRAPCHVLHFIGHGVFDEVAQDGLLILEDGERNGVPKSGQYLGTLLHDHPALRLVVLNACDTGRTIAADPFAGAAQTIIQQGIPAVVAMQAPVSDTVAIALAQAFYAALADWHPVDAALAEARKSIFTEVDEVEWATPVLYLRSRDGQLFDGDGPSAIRPPSTREGPKGGWSVRLRLGGVGLTLAVAFALLLWIRTRPDEGWLTMSSVEPKAKSSPTRAPSAADRDPVGATGITLQPGDLVIADPHANAVLFYNAQGQRRPLSLRIRFGSQPRGVALTKSGELVVAGFDRQLVLVDLDTSAQVNLGEIVDVSKPFGVVVDGAGAIIVADAERGVLRVDPKRREGSTLVPVEQLGYIAGVTLAGDGTIVVADQRERSIVGIDAATNDRRVISEGDNLVFPTGLATESADTVVVADQQAHAIVRVSLRDGTQTVVSRDGHLREPVGIAIRRDGTLVVADNSGSLVQVDPKSGAQTRLAIGGMLVSPEGVVIVPNP